MFVINLPGVISVPQFMIEFIEFLSSYLNYCLVLGSVKSYSA